MRTMAEPSNWNRIMRWEFGVTMNAINMGYAERTFQLYCSMQWKQFQWFGHSRKIALSQYSQCVIYVQCGESISKCSHIQINAAHMNKTFTFAQSNQNFGVLFTCTCFWCITGEWACIPDHPIYIVWMNANSKENVAFMMGWFEW